MAIIFHMETITDEDFHCSGVKTGKARGKSGEKNL